MQKLLLSDWDDLKKADHCSFFRSARVFPELFCHRFHAVVLTM